MRPSSPGFDGRAKLVHMANQIADNFRIQPEALAVAAIAEHITRYWTPRMRREILAHLDQGGVGLEPLVLLALRGMRAP